MGAKRAEIGRLSPRHVNWPRNAPNCTCGPEVFQLGSAHLDGTGAPVAPPLAHPNSTQASSAAGFPLASVAGAVATSGAGRLSLPTPGAAGAWAGCAFSARYRPDPSFACHCIIGQLGPCPPRPQCPSDPHRQDGRSTPLNGSHPPLRRIQPGGWLQPPVSHPDVPEINLISSRGPPWHPSPWHPSTEQYRVLDPLLLLARQGAGRAAGYPGNREERVD